jgi:hypothetical protein
MSVSLRRPTSDEYEGWSALELEGYISEIVASGSLSREAAEDQARRQDAELLPQGLDTPGHLIFRIEAEGQPLLEPGLSGNISADEEGSLNEEIRRQSAPVFFQSATGAAPFRSRRGRATSAMPVTAA